MAKAMKEKYDKYWGNVTKMNMLLYVLVVLDPRYKLEFVTFALEDMYGRGNSDGISELERAAHMEENNEYDIFDDLEPQTSSQATGLKIVEKVKRAMEDLFNEYQKKFSVQESGTSSSSSMSSQVTNTMESQNTNVLADKFKRRRTGGVVGEKSELEKYLNEDVEDTGDKKFDILGWWKINSARFPILAHIARDVSSIPVSTVASESAFSAGGRILDSFRSSLSPNMMEALICSQDWIRVKNQVVVKEDNDFVDNLESDMSIMRHANA